MRQKDQLELNLGTEAKGEAPSAAAQAAEARAAKACLERPAVAGPSMEAVIERKNLKQALAQVKRNKGPAGIDSMSVDHLPAYLKEHWPTIRAQLLEGTYKPQPVRRAEIPKASGGLRPLGIPTVLDRFIQQAVMQVLQADWDRTFSEMSFGFRPGRSAHQADAKRVADKRILKLIRGFLTAGALEGGLVSPTEEGAPQGGPLSPLLSNLMLDVLDKELEKRGHRFGRTSDGRYRTVPCKASQAQNQQSEERGRQTECPQVPGLQLYVRGAASAMHCAAGARSQGSNTVAHDLSNRQQGQREDHSRPVERQRRGSRSRSS
jgi:RNA-directed DNA polymerase